MPERQVHPTPEAPAAPKRPGWRLTLRALNLAFFERRTQRALFFCGTSLLVGLTLGGGWGILLCGLFGASLFGVVLVLRMQRHLRV